MCCSYRCDQVYDLTDHLYREHSINVFHCQFCDGIYKGTKRKLIKHVRTHLSASKGGSHECFACGKRLKTQKGLSEHLIKVHNNKCDLCGESFVKVLEFRKHGTRVHREAKKPRRKSKTGKENGEGKFYTCHLCGKQFSHYTGLYYHLKHVHEGIKKHECDICGRKFALRSARDDHRRIHTGERPYVCHTCGKAFKTKASLYIHDKTHTDSFPYPCTYCHRRFRWRQQLLGHITTHTGEKKHFCETCGKGFGVKNALTRHKVVHSQEKPYLCLICGSAFAQKRYLKNHEKTMHKTHSVVMEMKDLN